MLPAPGGCGRINAGVLRKKKDVQIAIPHRLWSSVYRVLQIATGVQIRNGTSLDQCFLLFQHNFLMYSVYTDRIPRLSGCNTYYPKYKNEAPHNFPVARPFCNDIP